jgi:hypothetical protein
VSTHSGQPHHEANEVAAEDKENSLETDDLFEMANLFPRTTGLPMTLWVSPRGNSRYDVRIKVNISRGNQMNPTNTAVIGVPPSPHVIAGSLSPGDEKVVFEWVSLNSAALLEYWEGKIDTVQLDHVLKPLPTPPVL